MPRHPELSIDIGTLDRSPRTELRLLWRKVLGEAPPACLRRDVLALGIACAIKERRLGGLTKAVSKDLDRLLAHALGDAASSAAPRPTSPLPRAGTVLVREWQGTTHHVTIVDDGFLWNGQTVTRTTPRRAAGGADIAAFSAAAAPDRSQFGALEAERSSQPQRQGGCGVERARDLQRSGLGGPRAVVITRRRGQQPLQDLQPRAGTDIVAHQVSQNRAFSRLYRSHYRAPAGFFAPAQTSRRP